MLSLFSSYSFLLSYSYYSLLLLCLSLFCFSFLLMSRIFIILGWHFVNEKKTEEKLTIVTHSFGVNWCIKHVSLFYYLLMIFIKCKWSLKQLYFTSLWSVSRIWRATKKKTIKESLSKKGKPRRFEKHAWIILISKT